MGNIYSTRLLRTATCPGRVSLKVGVRWYDTSYDSSVRLRQVKTAIKHRWSRWRDGRTVSTRYTRASIATNAEHMGLRNSLGSGNKCNGRSMRIPNNHHQQNDLHKNNNDVRNGNPVSRDPVSRDPDTVDLMELEHRVWQEVTLFKVHGRTTSSQCVRPVVLWLLLHVPSPSGSSGPDCLACETERTWSKLHVQR